MQRILKMTNSGTFFPKGETFDVASHFLKEFTYEVATQDNLATASPYLILLQMRKDVITDPDFSYDRVCYLDADEGSSLIEVEDVTEEKNNLLKVYVKEEWETVNAFFTRKACDKHIEENKHNLKNHRTFVIHLGRNPEMAMLLAVCIKMVDALERVAKFEKNYEKLTGRVVVPKFKNEAFMYKEEMEEINKRRVAEKLTEALLPYVDRQELDFSDSINYEMTVLVRKATGTPESSSVIQV
jgi:hypothetical protein